MSYTFNNTSNNEYLSHLFNVHPVWNYKYYFILENNNKIIDTIYIGAKEAKIQSKIDNKYYNITDDNIINEILSDNSSYNIRFVDCLTHDINFNKFKFEDKGKVLDIKHNILLLQLKEYDSNYEERLEEYGNRMKEIKQSWVLKQSKIIRYNIKGFDSITNEIKINDIEIQTDVVRFLELTNELTYKSVYNAVSKIY